MKRRPSPPADAESAAAPTDAASTGAASTAAESTETDSASPPPTPDATSDLAHTVTDRDSARDAPPPVVAAALAAGDEIDGLHIVRLVDIGGWGAVFEATELATGQRVALKLPRRDHVTDPRASRRFVREIGIAQGLRHPAILRVMGTGHTPDGRPYMMMEWHDGEPLSARLKREGALDLEVVARIADTLCDALAFAHAGGVVHRDLKPGNVMVGPGAPDRGVKLLDFGVAGFLGPAADEHGLTRTGELLGTPQTMAPEQLCAEAVDHRADIYAVGVTLFRMLTGRYPFEAATFAELRDMHLQVAPPRASALAPVSEAVDEVIVRCMAKRPDDRFASVADLAEALRRAVRDGHAPAVGGPTHAALGVAISVASSGSADDEMIFDERMRLLDAGADDLEPMGLRVIAESAERIVLCQALPPSADDQRRTLVSTLARLRDWLASPDAETALRHELAAAVHVARAPASDADAIERVLRRDVDDWAAITDAPLTLSHSATALAKSPADAAPPSDDADATERAAAIHPRASYQLDALATLLERKG